MVPARPLNRICSCDVELVERGAPFAESRRFRTRTSASRLNHLLENSAGQRSVLAESALFR